MAHKVKPEELESLLVNINHSIRHTGRYLLAQARNGYIGVDVYRGDASQGHGGAKIRTLVTGTGGECLAAAEAYAANPY